jgi:hypothetical protein
VGDCGGYKFGQVVDRFDVHDPDSPGADGLIHYVMDLEALIRWLALTFSYQDPTTGEVVVNDPIWTTYDRYGTHLPAAEKLQETWDKVMHDD